MLLAVLLVAFVILSLSLVNTIKEAKSERELEIKNPIQDYESLAFNDVSRFGRQSGEAGSGKIEEDPFYEVFKLKIAWKPYGLRNPAMASLVGDQPSDLTVPVVAAQCPFCKRIIPVYCFSNKGRSGECPVCHHQLDMPSKTFNDDFDVTGRSSDPDGDGLPLRFETKHNLMPGSAKLDKDNDGFSNLYEYMKGTDIDDDKSHPPLTDLIYISSRPRFEAIFKEVKPGRDGQPVASFEVTGKNRPTDVPANGTFRIGRREYTLVEIVSDTEVKLRLNPGGEVFPVYKGASGVIPIEEVEIMNLAKNNTISGVKVGTVIKINAGRDREDWTVTAINMAGPTAEIERTVTKDGNAETQRHTVTTQPMIPSRARLDNAK